MRLFWKFFLILRKSLAFNLVDILQQNVTKFQSPSLFLALLDCSKLSFVFFFDNFLMSPKCLSECFATTWIWKGSPFYSVQHCEVFQNDFSSFLIEPACYIRILFFLRPSFFRHYPICFYRSPSTFIILLETKLFARRESF